jgi:hypothetical protein
MASPMFTSWSVVIDALFLFKAPSGVRIDS